MYDWSYFTENNIMLEKQFGFRAVHSTNHVLLEQIDQICECFDGTSIIKEFLLTYQKLLIPRWRVTTKNLEKYAICGKNCYHLKVVLQTGKNILSIKMISRSRNLENCCN